MDPLKDQIQQQIHQNESDNQYGVSNTPFHTHNDIDSPRISFKNIADRIHLAQVFLDGDRAATAGNYNAFFVVPFQMRFSGVTISFSALGTDGSAVTLTIEKLTSGTASGSGTVMLASTLNLKSTINTPQYGTLAAIPRSSFVLKRGERLGLKLSGTPTSVANLAVTCQMVY